MQLKTPGENKHLEERTSTTFLHVRPGTGQEKRNTSCLLEVIDHKITDHRHH